MIRFCGSNVGPIDDRNAVKGVDIRFVRAVRQIEGNASLPGQLEHWPRKAIKAAVEHAVQRFSAYRFHKHAYLHFFAAWTVFYGPDFEKRDPTGKLEEICLSSAPEAERFKAFRDRFDNFSLKAA